MKFILIKNTCYPKYLFLYWTLFSNALFFKELLSYVPFFAMLEPFVSAQQINQAGANLYTKCLEREIDV